MDTGDARHQRGAWMPTASFFRITDMMEGLINTTSAVPPRLLIYGDAGVGKTTLAAQANAVTLDMEGGGARVRGLIRTPYLTRWPDAREWLSRIVQATSSPEPPEAVAIDTIDWLSMRIEQHVTQELDRSKGGVTNTLGGAHGGFFKAREIVQNIVSLELLPELNTIAARCPVILLAHARNDRTSDAEGMPVQRAEPKIPEYIRGLFVEWADAMLYATRRGDDRTLTTESTMTVHAKNRYSLPPVLPFDWPTLVQSMKFS